MAGAGAPQGPAEVAISQCDRALISQLVECEAPGCVGRLAHSLWGLDSHHRAIVSRDEGTWGKRPHLSCCRVDYLSAPRISS